jgi:antirestriction protein ArdC
MAKKNKPDVYQIVTDRILTIMENGVLPWQFPWNNVQANLKTKRPYNGINIMMLDIIQYVMEYKTPWWLTYNQATELGGQVRKGEQSSIVVFWKMIEKTDKQTGEKTGEWCGFYRYYNVFNADQIDFPEGFELPAQIEGGFDEILEAETIINNYIEREGISVFHGGNVASHNVSGNSKVSMPDRDNFISEQAYYKVFFHELVHSTRHPERLNRPRDGWGGEDGYSREELVAEMGAAIMANILGFDPNLDQASASYINEWASAFRDDKNMLLQCASKAKMAVKYILGETEN